MSKNSKNVRNKHFINAGFWCVLSVVGYFLWMATGSRDLIKFVGCSYANGGSDSVFAYSIPFASFSTSTLPSSADNEESKESRLKHTYYASRAVRDHQAFGL